MSRWWEYDNGPRRPAKDGIRARSARGEIGETWWSQRFIKALQHVTDPGRLNRGRSYARTGQVMDLRVRAGSVSAQVQGSAARPYAVSISLAPFTDAEWARAEAALADQALFLAALLAGQMPQDVEQAFTAAGLTLFPAKPSELRSQCTCPDAANPCKHIAATYYILAEAFDADPFLVLCWRGRERDHLLEHLRALRGAAEAADGGAGDEDAGDGDDAGGDASGVAESALDDAEPRDFWRAGGGLAALAFAPRAPDVPDAVLRQLGPLPPDAGGAEADAALAAAYAAFTRAAERRAFGAAGGFAADGGGGGDG